MDWVTYFKHNREKRLNIPWEQEIVIDPALRGPLARSLQRFQLGESGDGAHLKGLARLEGNSEYEEAIAMFVAEEQTHAALMARLLERLGSPLLKAHWSDHLFRTALLLSGLRSELMVIAVAEVVATRYFSLLYSSAGDPAVRAVCAQIMIDEEGHIAFQCDALQPTLSRLPTPARHALFLGWRLFFTLTCLAVSFDHRSLLRAVGKTPRAFRQECMETFEEVALHVFTPKAGEAVRNRGARQGHIG